MAEARFAPPKPNVSVFQGGSGQCLTLNNGRSMPAAGLGAWALRGRRAHGLRLQASSRRYGVLLRKRTGGRPCGARSRALGHPPRRHFCADETLSFAVRRSRASFEGRDDATRFGLCRHGDPSSSRANDLAACRAKERAVERGLARPIGLSNGYVDELTTFLPGSARVRRSFKTKFIPSIGKGTSFLLFGRKGSPCRVGIRSAGGDGRRRSSRIRQSRGSRSASAERPRRSCFAGTLNGASP